MQIDDFFSQKLVPNIAENFLAFIFARLCWDVQNYFFSLVIDRGKQIAKKIYT